MDLYAWGANSYGQLGVGYKSEQILNPTLLSLSSEENLEVKNVKSISAGAGHTLILTKDGLVFSCGWNTKGQLGYETESLTFKQIKSLNKHKIVQISCGWDYNAAISNFGNIFVWGSNAFSQLGLSKNIKQISNPTLLENIAAKQVSCGLRHMAIVTFENEVIVTGNGNKSQLGLINESGNSLRETTLKKLPNLHDIIAVSCGQFHTLALNKNGIVFGWGNNKHGQLGFDPEKSPQIVIPTVINLPHVIPYEIFTGWTHSVVLTKSRDLFNFGRNCYGQLGDTKREKCWQPLQVNCGKISKFSAGAEHNLAVTFDHKILCWGWNEHGNCGTGDTENVEYCKEIIINGIVDFVACGTGQSFAVVNKNSD